MLRKIYSRATTEPARAVEAPSPPQPALLCPNKNNNTTTVSEEDDKMLRQLKMARP
ncbi:unnamed protein product, partial [Didymodactylos carnosus]